MTREDSMQLRHAKRVVDFPLAPGWVVAYGEWNIAGWDAGWLRFWKLCRERAGGDIESAKRLWRKHLGEATEAIAWSQTPAAESGSYFGFQSCWENSARRAVARLDLDRD